jgi:hypothetical protein
MTRDEILIKAAKTIYNAHAPVPRPHDENWRERAIAKYMARFATGLDAVEADIRADERKRISMELAAFAQECQAAGRPTMAGVVKDVWSRVQRRLDR